MFPYHRLANREKLILPLEKSIKTLKSMIIATVGTEFFEQKRTKSISFLGPKIWNELNSNMKTVATTAFFMHL